MNTTFPKDQKKSVWGYSKRPRIEFFETMSFLGFPSHLYVFTDIFWKSNNEFWNTRTSRISNSYYAAQVYQTLWTTVDPNWAQSRSVSDSFNVNGERHKRSRDCEKSRILSCVLYASDTESWKVSIVDKSTYRKERKTRLLHRYMGMILESVESSLGGKFLWERNEMK